MMPRIFKNRHDLAFIIISLLLVIILPAVCFADAQRVFGDNNKAVVVVVVYDKEGKTISFGSGFVVGQNGVIVTNYHVVGLKKTHSIRIKAGDKIYKVTGIISLDKKNDIAILKANAKNLRTVKLGNLANTEIGSKVYVIGSPEGFENTISDGILSGKRELAPEQIILQITAPISHGSSGGPVFNDNGEVIGVATAMLDPKKAQNINFAMSVDVFKNKVAAEKVVAIEKGKFEDYKKVAGYWLSKEYGYSVSGNYRDAADACTKAIEYDPNYGYAYFRRGINYMHFSIKSAIKDFTRAIELTPEWSPAYTQRGIAYNALGNYQQAIKDFTRAIELTPGDVEARIGRGSANDEMGNYQQAITDYNKAIEFEQNNAYIYVNRGATYGRLGDYQAAIKDFTKAIHINPDFAEAYFYRAYSYEKSGDNQQGDRDFRQAARLGNKDAQDLLKKQGIEW